MTQGDLVEGLTLGLDPQCSREALLELAELLQQSGL
jgi:hypothetical protein